MRYRPIRQISVPAAPYCCPRLARCVPPTLGRYGRLRLRYLLRHRFSLFSRLAAQGYLPLHLETAEDEAHRLITDFIALHAAEYDISPALKRADPLEWTGRMNLLKLQAEELLLPGLLYAEEYPQPEEDPPF